jgi:hypothetical protein
MPLFAYLCGAPQDLETQAQAVTAFIAAQGWPPPETFRDSTTLERRLPYRAQGRRLLCQADRDDRILFPDLGAFHDVADLLCMVGWMGRRGIACTFIAQGFSTDTPTGQVVLRALGDAEAARKRRLSLAHKRVAARLKAERKRCNQWPVRRKPKAQGTRPAAAAN